jgi:hypothetical protein
MKFRFVGEEKNFGRHGLLKPGAVIELTESEAEYWRNNPTKQIRPLSKAEIAADEEPPAALVSGRTRNSYPFRPVTAQQPEPVPSQAASGHSVGGS